MTEETVSTPPPEESRLEQLGYSQQLVRRLNIPEVVGLAMADVSPTMAVLFLSAGVFVMAARSRSGPGCCSRSSWSSSPCAWRSWRACSR